MINRSIELEATLRLALEALENLINQHYAETTTNDDLEKADNAITTIKEALAQPEQRSVSEQQEPVAWRWQMSDVHPHLWEVSEKPHKMALRAEPLYTSQPQRLPLTDEEIDSIADKFTVRTGDMWEPELCIEFNDSCKSVHSFARAIEAAHGITASEAEDSARSKK